MCAKPFIAGWLLVLALTVSGANHAVHAGIVAPASAGPGNSAHWESIPEDTSSWRREPFKSSAPAKQAPGGPAAKQLSLIASPELALHGIMKIDKHYYAIINGRTVKPGDVIDGWTITEISHNRVTIRHAKEKKIYDIYQGRIDRGTR